MMFLENVINITKLIMVIISLGGYSFLITNKTNYHIGESFVITLCSISSLMFLSSVFLQDIFWITKIIYILGILIFLYSASLYFFQHKLASFSQNNFATTFFLSLFAVLVYNDFLFQNSYFHIWDEFSHWGVSIKEMFSKNKTFTFSDIQKGSSDPFYYYLPGSSITLYYFLKNTFFSFKEDVIYIAMSTILSIPIIAILDKVLVFKLKFLKNFKVVIIVLLFLIIQILLLGGYYYQIYVDALLGVYFGFLLFFINTKTLENRTQIISFNLSIFAICFFISIIKHSGIFLIILSLPLIIHKHFDNKNNIKSKIFNSVFSVLIILLTILFVKKIWNINTGKGHSAGNFNQIDFYNLTQNQISIIYNFINNLIKNFIKYVKYPIIISIIYIFYKTRKKNDLPNSPSFIFLIKYATFVYIFYSLGLLYLYLSVFGEYEAMQCASYTRYMDTIIISLTMLLLSDFIYRNDNKGLFIGIVLLICTVFHFKKIIRYYNNLPNNIVKNIKLAYSGVEGINRETIQNEAIELKQVITNDNKKILVLFHNFVYPECYIFNYEISPYSNIFDERTPLATCVGLLGDPKTQIFKILSVNDLSNADASFDTKHFIKNYDLLYIPRLDDDLKKVLAKYFVKGFENYKFFLYNTKLQKFVPYNYADK